MNLLIKILFSKPVYIYRINDILKYKTLKKSIISRKSLYILYMFDYSNAAIDPTKKLLQRSKNDRN